MEIVYLEGNIREYDLGSANVSILRENELISEDLYLDMKEGDKLTRNRIVGLLIRKFPEVYELLQKEIAKYVDLFIKSNKIPDNKILEICKDAIYCIDVKPTDRLKGLKFRFGDYITFVPKSDYLSMVSFTPKDESNTSIKFYLSIKENKVDCRYSGFDYSSPLYPIVYDLMRFKYNNKVREYGQSLKELIIATKKDGVESICNACSNERLVNVFRELAVL